MGSYGWQGVGRPRMHSDAPLEKFGVALHPKLGERLRQTASARKTTVSTLIRTVLETWERENFDD